METRSARTSVKKVNSMKHMTIMDIENNRGFKVKYMTILADIHTDPDDEEIRSPVVKSVRFFETKDDVKQYISELEEGRLAFAPQLYEMVDGLPVERKYTLVRKTMTVITDLTLI